MNQTNYPDTWGKMTNNQRLDWIHQNAIRTGLRAAGLNDLLRAQRIAKAEKNDMLLKLIEEEMDRRGIE